MNRALLRLSLACLVMFVLLLINVNYVQGFRANSLAGEKGNVRVFDQQFQYQRGSINTAGGEHTIASHPGQGDQQVTSGYYPAGGLRADHRLHRSTVDRDRAGRGQVMLSGTDPTLTVHNLIAWSPASPSRAAPST